MIVAITGGTGFIGRRLVTRHLERGDEVRVLSRQSAATARLASGVSLWQGDLSAPQDLSGFAAGADVLYHCAAELVRKERMVAVHVDGTRNLMDAAAGRVGRWVQLSSCGAYGRRASGVITEDSALNPVDEYETTKTRSDLLVTEAAGAESFACVILRPSIVYGAGMPNQSLNALIGAIDAGWFFLIGPPGASANYIHVENVVDALVLCATAPAAAGRVYNLSDHRPLEEFVGCIAAALGRASRPLRRLPASLVRTTASVLSRAWRRSPLTQSRIDALTTRAIYPSSRIQSELGYRHRVTMEQGLSELVQYWKQSVPHRDIA